jgi:hypothetical protein
MSEQPEHGQPGHVCHTIDATDAVAGVIIRPLPDTLEGHAAFEVEAWAHGMPKPTLAGFLRSVADAWDADARAETAELN